MSGTTGVRERTLIEQQAIGKAQGLSQVRAPNCANID
jgi:hypothetical protein